MKIFIVVLNWNGKDFLTGCLNSLKELKTDNCTLEAVVVDNASTDGSVKLVETRYKDIKVLKNKENLGFAEGNNVGIRYALKNGADYVLILNPDTIVDKNLVVQLISAQGGSASGGKVAKKSSKIGILGPKIYFAPGYEFHKERYKPEERGKVIWYAGGLMDWNNILGSHRGVDEVDRGQYDELIETDFASGCAMLIKREVFEKIGLFDKRYFLYLEDNDFCQRARKAGFKIVYVPGAKMYHLNAGSSAVGGPLQDYFITRNRLLFGMKFAPKRTKLALLRESFKILLTGRKWQKRGVVDFCFGRFGKGSWK